MRTIILSLMFAGLVWWVACQLNAPAGVNEYRESVENRQDIESRIAYHGLDGVVMLRESPRGWEFSRDGQWCKL